MIRRTLLALSLPAAVLLAPAAASAAVRSVAIGPPKAVGKQFQKLAADANAFFPSTTVLHVGDRTVFRNFGFHNVDIPARGRRPQPLFTPRGTISGALDAAGTPFWFNGRPNLQFNPVIFAPGGPNGGTVNGSQEVVSKVPAAGPVKPFTVRWAKAGTYTIYCDVHAGMKAKVVVRRRVRRIPSARAHASAVARQVSRDLVAARRLQKPRSRRGVVNVGESARGGVEVFGMFPGTLTVKKGTTLRFQMSPSSVDVHTATFGPGNPLTQPKSYLGKLAGSLNSPAVDDTALYPSDPRLVSLTARSHGNGFWNSGVLDRSRATPLPSSRRLTFGQRGTFIYYCLIHPFMKGTIRVR